MDTAFVDVSATTEQLQDAPPITISNLTRIYDAINLASNKDLHIQWMRYPAIGTEARARFTERYIQEHPEYQTLVREVLSHEQQDTL
jgi:hypothetical protein